MHSNDLAQPVTPAVTGEEPKRSRKGIGGAPAGNRNATRSGRRAWETVKRLPKSCGAIRQQLYAERDDIELSVGRQHGEVSLYHAALIQSAVRHSGRAQLLERWLRVEEGLSLNERLAVLKEIGAASDSRDKCLKLLGLDVAHDATRDAWASVLSRAVPADNASESRTEPQEWQPSTEGIYETRTSSPVTRCAGEGEPVAAEAPSQDRQSCRRSGDPLDGEARPAAAGEHNAEEPQC